MARPCPGAAVLAVWVGQVPQFHGHIKIRIPEKLSESPPQSDPNCPFALAAGTPWHKFVPARLERVG